MLNLGWHSGTVFGPAASSAAVSKLICSSADQIEDAIGIACTQACGLMSAQFESMVKRMQHGFAARNGLFAALMARSGYTGIRSVMERPWGGFLSTFSHGLPAPDMAKDETMELSKYSEGEILKDLSQVWQVDQVAIKPYASMAATHGTIDCIRNLQKRFPERLDAEKSGVVQVVNGITSILIEMSAPAFKRGGWTPDRPVAVTGAQMNSTIVAAMQVVDGRVLLPSQFRPDQLNRDLIWTLVMKTKCAVDPNFVDDPQHRWRQRVTVHFDNGEVVSAFREKPAGVDPALSNEGILTKWRNLTNDLMDVERRDMIERLVLGLETVENAADLGDALGRTRLRL
ncbi:MAG: hypothetical protein LQ351_004575 [Letrouitia transgressa]|nr:MAG: hypothetical protein LQ351_004575 [Letrouitia transgressa]